MTLTFYYLSGSPFSWKVWLALEHKKLGYKLELLSAQAGDLISPAYKAVNPRARAPAILDDGFSLYESAAIIDYLEMRYPASGEPLWPNDPRSAALARRVAIEGDSYIYPPIRRLVVELLGHENNETDQAIVDAARRNLQPELNRLDQLITGPFLMGTAPTATDYGLYPFLALLDRVAKRHPAQRLDMLITAKTRTWMQAIERLAYFNTTYPPHWRTQ